MSPQFKGKKFSCPICKSLAKQDWITFISFTDVAYSFEFRRTFENLDASICQGCDDYTLWKNEKIIYPDSLIAPDPNDDMPVEVKEIYEEARAIHTKSLRATAALLRLAVEQLCNALSEKKGSLNENIKDLVERGLSQDIQRALDTVRVIGNDSIHPLGQIDLSGGDGGEIINALFYIVNFIVETMITEPRKRKEIFERLPEDKRQGIENRDKE